MFEQQVFFYFKNTYAILIKGKGIALLNGEHANIQRFWIYYD